MKIQTYKSVGPIKFGMSETDVSNQLGSPIEIRTNNTGELEYHYDELIIRFDAETNCAREVTLLPKKTGEIIINDTALDWRDDLFTILCREDGNPWEFYGFIVLLNLGITLTGFHDGEESQRAISAFTKGDWDQFRAKMKALKVCSPFKSQGG